MNPQFGELVDRTCSDSSKWYHLPDQVLPFGVADMDFLSPEPVIKALRERVDHGVYGYPVDPFELREVLVERLAERYGWRVAPDALVFIPGCIPGLALTLRTLPAGSSVVVQPPVYGPFFHLPGGAGLECLRSPLGRTAEGRYYQDPERLEHDIQQNTSALMLCNPHNPVGRVFTREELESVAEVCLRHDLLILSDDIHCELIHAGYRHTPIASLSPEVEARCVTVMAPSKTFNMAGLHCAFAIIPNPDLRQSIMKTGAWAMLGSNIMGYAAALAAYRDSGPWLDALMVYLGENRDLVTAAVRERMAGVTLEPSEGTYLAWLDCSGTRIEGSMGRFFHEHAKMVVGGGEGYGGDPHLIRLNYGCPRPMLEEGLRRMATALSCVEKAG